MLLVCVGAVTGISPLLYRGFPKVDRSIDWFETASETCVFRVGYFTSCTVRQQAAVDRSGHGWFP